MKTIVIKLGPGSFKRSVTNEKGEKTGETETISFDEKTVHITDGQSNYLVNVESFRKEVKENKGQKITTVFIDETILISAIEQKNNKA